MMERLGVERAEVIGEPGYADHLKCIAHLHYASNRSQQRHPYPDCPRHCKTTARRSRLIDCARRFVPGGPANLLVRNKDRTRNRTSGRDPAMSLTHGECNAPSISDRTARRALNRGNKQIRATLTTCDPVRETHSRATVAGLVARIGERQGDLYPCVAAEKTRQRRRVL
jgi:hypothetical protein